MRTLHIYLFFQLAAAVCLAQPASIKIVPATTELKVPLTPPGRTVIEPVTIEFELTGTLSGARKDTTIRFKLSNRTKDNKPFLLDSVLMLQATEWPGEGLSTKIKRDLYLKHAAVKSQNFDESADILIQSQPQEVQTIRFLSSVTNKSAKTDTTKKAESAPADSFNYNKSFGYNNYEKLFELSVKRSATKAEIKICSDEEDSATNTCHVRVLPAEIPLELFSTTISSLLQKFTVPGSGFDKFKLAPKIEELFAGYEEYKEKQKPKVPTEGDNQLAVITKQLEELFQEKSNNKAIGYFKLANTRVSIKNDTKGATIKEKSLKIESVEIVLASGAIRKNGIKVITEDGAVYRNRLAPITLYRLDQRKSDQLFVDDNRPEKTGFYIELGDVLNYIYNGKFSYPAEGIVHLTPAKPSDTLYVGSTISDLLDVAIYSDLLALLGRKPNGIIQTQATGTFITNTGTPFRNLDIIPHNFVKAHFRLSKYDSRFAQLDSSNFRDKSLDTVSRLYLHQIAFLQAGLKTNLLRIGIGNNQQVFINAGAEINLTNADSLFNKDLVSINYYPEIEYTISRLENFGLEASLRYIYQAVSKNSPFKNQEITRILNPQVVIYYYPFTNPNNRIYVRYAHFAQRKDAKDNYPQFQFGFKTNLFGNKNKSD